MVKKDYPQNGSIFRVHKNNGYTHMSNHHLRNKELPLKAKGLLSVIFSLPPEWNFSINGLASLSFDGRDSVLSIIKILQKAGYMYLEKVRNERGQFDTIYNIYEEPQEKEIFTESEIPTRGENTTESDLPNRQNRIGSTESENPIQLNTNELNTDKSSIDNSNNITPVGDVPPVENPVQSKYKKAKGAFGVFSNVALTNEHIKKLREIYETDENLNKAINILSTYKAANGKKYKNDYAVLNEFNWVYKKVFPNKVKKESAAEKQKNNSAISDYENMSRW